MFKRRRGRHAAPTKGPEDVSTADDAVDTDDAEPADDAAVGPWDVDDAPSDDIPRVDLGALRVPTLADVELRVEADPQGEISSIALVQEQNALQIGVFAAPRSEDIWDEVRDEIEAGLRGDGGVTEHHEGEFGAELWGTVGTPEGKQALRFIGIDGPRWFLRVLVTGPAATDPTAGEALLESIRQIVVVRGTDPLPVRDPLPLRLPKDVVEQAADQADPDSPARPAAPRRGPEITEIG